MAVLGFTQEGLADRKHAVAWIKDTIRQTATIDDDAVHMAGPVVDNVSVDVASNDSLDTYAAPAAVLILLLTWWSLKSFGYACLVFVVSLWCVGLAFATMYLFGDRMNPVLIVMPVLVLALGVSGGIHLVNYLVESLAAGGRSGAATRAVRLGWLPCLLSAGTTAIGLASLVVSELEPIRARCFLSCRAFSSGGRSPTAACSPIRRRQRDRATGAASPKALPHSASASRRRSWRCFSCRWLSPGRACQASARRSASTRSFHPRAV
jgi:hypothetical protein